MAWIMLRFWIYQESKYAISLQRVLNKILHLIYLTGFWIYHGFKICQASGCTRVLKLHCICLTGFRIFLRFWIWQGSKYTKVLITQGSEQNAPLWIFHNVLNTSLVLKCQDYRKLRFLCKLYSRDSRYSECASGSRYTKIFNASWISIC